MLVFPCQPESRKDDSELSVSPVLSSHPLPPPTQVLTRPSCFCPNAQPKGETPGFQLLLCGSGEVQPAGHPASWSQDSLRPGMTPKVTAMVSGTPAKSAKRAALWLPLSGWLLENPGRPQAEGELGPPEGWQRHGFLPTQWYTGHHQSPATIFVLLTNKDREAQKCKRPHATPQPWPRVRKRRKSVCVGPGLCPQQLPPQTPVLPGAAPGRSQGTPASCGLLCRQTARCSPCARRAECPTSIAQCFSVTSITTPIGVPPP